MTEKWENISISTYNLNLFQRPTCHNSGLKLRIHSGVTFSNYVLTAKWLTAKVNISELIFDCRNFNTIHVDAFATEAFSKVEHLTLQFASMRTMEMGSLNGFDSLRSLSFASAGIRVFTDGVLDNLARTLENLTLIELSSYSSPLLIDGLTGSAPMTALKRVQFNYNMDRTITHRTFVGLTSVTHLDLQSCQIVAIGVNAFDPISNTIEVLNLAGNKLTTFVPGLFDLIIPRDGVRITIENNLWECDCQLCYFKWVLLNSEVIDQFRPIECRTPSFLRFAPVKSTDFCFESTCESYEVIPTLNPPITTIVPTTDNNITLTTRELYTTTLPPTNEEETTKNPTTIIEDDAQHLVPQICSTFTSGDPIIEIIHLNASVSSLKIFDINAGEVFVGLEAFNEHSALLWYDSDGYNCVHERKSTSNNIIGCGSMQCGISFYNGNGDTQKIHIKNLKTNTVYMFCMVGDVDNAIISPLNCIPHFVASDTISPTDMPPVWITTDYRELLIGMIVLGITVCVLLGMVLGYVILQKNPGWLRGSKHVTMVNSSVTMSHQKSDRINSVR